MHNSDLRRITNIREDDHIRLECERSPRAQRITSSPGSQHHSDHRHNDDDRQRYSHKWSPEDDLS
jgi:hypothetical protein